jgi:dynein heavy chain, axonemal
VAWVAGVQDTWENLYSFFLDRVREKLHIILCFSPVQAKFASKAQQFPGLINGCTIDWFLPWPEDALLSVAGKLLSDFDMPCSDKVRT